MADRPPPTNDELIDHLDLAWSVIANVGLRVSSGWDSQHPEWVEAAERWRDRWHELLAAHCASKAEGS